MHWVFGEKDQRDLFDIYGVVDTGTLKRKLFPHCHLLLIVTLDRLYNRKNCHVSKKKFSVFDRTRTSFLFLGVQRFVESPPPIFFSRHVPRDY
jgi:hypothetical protein